MVHVWCRWAAQCILFLKHADDNLLLRGYGCLTLLLFCLPVFARIFAGPVF